MSGGLSGCDFFRAEDRRMGKSQNNRPDAGATRN
jgi:hypothetical protein